jgi:8-oxo-dGTP diphosphatase
MQMEEIKHFNVRVYGLVINENNELLVADEYCQKRYMTKFPGGGLEFGEGLIDGLKREFMEECNQEVDVLEHFYTTDYYVKSMFRGGGQLISIYYICKFKEAPKFQTTSKAFEGMSEIDDTFTFRWISLESISPEDVTWPIDKKVVEMLKSRG